MNHFSPEGLQAYIDQMPFTKPLGFKVAEARRGFVRVTAQPQPKLFNHFGTYQAGVLCVLAEITGGVLCGTFHDIFENFLITKQTQVKYERATHLAVTAEASLDEASILKILSLLERQRKTDVEADIVIKTGESEIIARSKGLYYLRVGIPDRFDSKSRQ